MNQRWLLAILVLGAAVFAIGGVARLVVDGDAIAFAHLTTALGLALFAVRLRMPTATNRLWYAPEILLLLGLLQYGYDLLGV